MPDPDTLLRRRPAAAALTEAGYPIAPATLATLACRGGGPRYAALAVIPCIAGPTWWRGQVAARAGDPLDRRARRRARG